MLPLVLIATALQAESLTSTERSQAMSALHATRKLFLDSLAGVSETQWNWKPSPEVWSIAEVAEHVALSEDFLFQVVKKVLGSPPAGEEQRAATKGKDESMPKRMVDRSGKAQAPEMLKPSNRWKTRDELIAHFKESRDRNIAFVESTDEDMRAHVAPHPVFGPLDAYQWLLGLSAHSERHTLQLNEVKTLAGYPRK